MNDTPPLDSDEHLSTGDSSTRHLRVADDSLPPIWNIRARRNGLFSNRDEELRQISDYHSSRGIVAINSSTSAHSTGKSELAREYAYRNASDYQVIWWVLGSKRSLFEMQYAQLMAALGMLRGDEEGVDYTPEQTRDFLAERSGWLLIIDDLEDFGLLNEYLPKQFGGHVIVTTALEAPPSRLPLITLFPFSEENAVTYLKSSLKTDPVPLIASIRDQTRLDPLNLRLLSTYSRVTGQTVDAALEQVQSAMKKFSKSVELSQHPQAWLLGQISVIFERLKSENAAARDLLSLLAYLGAHDIPLFMFDQEKYELSNALNSALREESGLEALLGTLTAYGLVDRAEDSVSMHESIQEAVSALLPKEAKRAWANASAKLVFAAFPNSSQYPKPDPICNRLLPHAQASARHSSKMEYATEGAAELLYQTGLYLQGRQAFSEAKTAYQRAITISNSLHGNSNSALATQINSLGTVEHEMGNLEAARDCFQKSFEIIEVLYGPAREAVYTVDDDSVITVPIRNLCAVLEELGDIKAAQVMYERAMNVFLAVYDWNHPLVAECANRFGKSWHRLKKLPKARNSFEKAVLAEESTPEPNEESLALYLNNLALVLIESKEPKLAIERLKQALRLDERNFEASDPVIGKDLLNLGNAYRALKRLDEAEDYYKRALDILEETDEAQPDRVASVLNYLGVILLDKGTVSQARTCFERALEITEAAHGSEAPELVRSLNNLGRALAALEAYTQATNAFQRALTIARKSGDKDDERISTILYRLGRCQHDQQLLPEALETLQRALSMDTDIRGKEHPAVARNAFAVGCVLADMEDTIVALGHMTLALHIYENVYGKDSSRARMVREKLDSIGS